MSPGRAFLDKYCVSCHNERLKTAGLMLDKANVEDIGADAAIWEKVVRKLQSGAMPPPVSRRGPTRRTAHPVRVVARDGARPRRRGRVPIRAVPAIHRLNRAEYANAIRDLLDLDIDSRSLLPADDEDHGFDNIADVLSVSPTLLERYHGGGAPDQPARGRRSGDSSGRSKTYTVPSDWSRTTGRATTCRSARAAVAVRHHFPLDGEYVVQISFTTNALRLHPRSGPCRIDLDVRVDGERVKLFTVGGEHARTAASPGNVFAGDVIGDPAVGGLCAPRRRAPGGARRREGGDAVVAVSFERAWRAGGFSTAPLDMATFRYRQR